jgi:DNA-binding NtrC family response regulator
LEELEFSQQAQELLVAYSWPGNIRELISVVERAAILSDNNQITTEDLFLDSRSVKKQKSIDSMEEELIREVIESVDKDLDEATKILGMSKVALNKKIEKYGIRI